MLSLASKVILTSTFLYLLATVPVAVDSLPIVRRNDPILAPGGNFDMSFWELQLPVGEPGSPITIESSKMQGHDGYQDPGHHYFFTESGDGALVMKVPGSPSSAGCVTTTHSLHCRTELREVDPSTGAPTSWSSDGTNRLKATLSVVLPDDSGHGTVIGQIHIDDSISSKPVCELFYNSDGDIAIGVEQSLEGGNEVVTKIGNVPVGQKFDYELEYSGNLLKVAINGVFHPSITVPFDPIKSYYKVGNYNQGNSASDVHFYAITVEH